MLPRRCRVVLLAVSIAACGGHPSSFAPSQTGTLTGRWSGRLFDSRGEGAGTLDLAQLGINVSGTIAFVEPGTGRQATGTFTGTVGGQSVGFSIRVVQGGYPVPSAGCESESTGAADFTDTTLEGGYTGSAGGAVGCLSSWSGGHIYFSKN